MGKGLQNYPNITAPNATYPNGAIKNNPGNGTGTPFNETVYQDIHQTFAKFMRDSFTTPNNQFDNETNGYQYFTAIRDLFGNHRKLIFKQGAAATDLADANYYPLVIVKAGAAAGHIVSLVAPTGSYTGRVTVVNYSSNSVSITDNAGTNNINGVAPPYTIAAGDAVTFLKSGGNWVVENKWAL